MAALTISGEALLAALTDRLEHLQECERLLFDLYNHPDEPLKAIPKKVKLGDWELSALTDVVRWVTKFRADAELRDAGPKLRPVEAFLAELPHLQRAKELVDSVAHVMRYHLSDKTRIENNKIVYRSLRDRFDHLTRFDDSE